MSNRPGRLVEDVRADLPRSGDFSVFGHPEFMKLKARLFALVRSRQLRRQQI
jgi:hypothetical protein